MPDDRWIFPDWPVPANVRAVVTTREGPGISAAPFDRFNLGSRCGDDPAAVAHNRAALVTGLDLPSPPRWLHQVHGIAVAGKAAEGVEPKADAAYASAGSDVLAILTADCMPVLFASDDGREIAAAHAGWRGLAGGVLEASVAAFTVPSARILTWMGPCIGAASYEVGDEVRETFVSHDAGAAAAFVATRPGHWLCDLYALARLRLRALGVSGIHGGGFDTFSDKRFYSYRRDGAGSGRFATLVWQV
ncbi:MAG TPA: peptidoglycan editing factor PgeF [Luteibacter sp.]|jgi:YfiH family protein|nr:peptidoglycan editing factor PgeF [Luteibacter sp.]